MHDDILLPGFKRASFWWDKAPPEPSTGETPPAQVDVAVVGGGLAGVFTGLHLARGGLDVVVLEAGRPGENASTRNMGAVGRTLRLKFTALEARYGLENAKRVCQEAKAWLEWTARFIEDEGIDCGFHRNGRINAAHCPAAYEEAARELEAQSRHMEVDTELVPKAEQRRELGTDVYHGCTIYHDTGQLDPGRYHAGVSARARAAGAHILGGTRVTNIERAPGGFRVSTPRGSVAAREVVLATNAETGRDNQLFRHFHRRLLPFYLSNLVTEPLEPELLSRIVPTGRLVLETRRLQMAVRPLKDDTRLVVASRYFVKYNDEVTAALAVRRDLATRYPELAGVRVSHSWFGEPCFTYDELPHLGTHEGVHYLIGFNGVGVPITGYFGHKLAQRILGGPDRDTVFADIPFPAVPGDPGWSWLSSRVLRLGAMLYRALDRRDSGLPR